jgi:hypothetical protein
MVYQMYKDDNLSYEDIEKLIQRFGNQTLDFFGAIRAGTYDSQILCAPPCLCLLVLAGAHVEAGVHACMHVGGGMLHVQHKCPASAHLGIDHTRSSPEHEQGTYVGRYQGLGDRKAVQSDNSG